MQYHQSLCMWVPVSMAGRVLRLRIGLGLQIWRVSANMLNKQSWAADRGSPPAWGLDEGLTIPHRKKETYESFR